VWRLLYNAIPKLAGIEFIKAYVEAAYYENKFCSYFSAKSIHHLLYAYEKNYQELLVNIYEPVLIAAIGCVITGTDIYRLDISEGGTAYIYRLLTEAPEKDIFMALQDTVNVLTRFLTCSPGLIRYIHNSMPMIIAKIEKSLQEQALERIFVRPA